VIGSRSRRTWREVCDVEVGLLGSLMDSGGPEHSNLGIMFPKFKGTQDQFSDCSGQGSKGIWANQKGQLDAWQQLCMFACVKKFFVRFWTVVGMPGARRRKKQKEGVDSVQDDC
jgi:hypothetical protein